MVKPLFVDLSNPAGSPRDREYDSPLGLFEKFKVESPLNTLSDSDPDVQIVSVQEPPRLKCKIEHSVPNRNTPTLNISSVREKMRLLMNTVSHVKKKGEDQCCRLLGSWNADSKEVEILDELERPPDHIGLGDQILIQDVCSDDEDVIIMGEEHLRVSAGPAHPNVNLRKRKAKNKSYDRVKTLMLAPGKPPKDIRATTVQTLYEVLLKRIQETENLVVLNETVKTLAKNVEKEMFNLYHDTGVKYKQKYRSLLFNLRDSKNKIFFHGVVLGEITPQCLVQMSPTEMAGQELTNWRNQERLHALEIIKRAEKELHHKQQMTKLTHKGLIEIDTTPDQMLTLEDLSDKPWCIQDFGNSSAIRKTDTTSQHKSHLLDENCLICMEENNPSDEMDHGQWTKLKSLVKTRSEKSSVRSLSSGKTTESRNKDVLAAEIEGMSSSAVWKGLIHSFSIKQFKVTAFQVSGYSTHLCQELPKIITCSGLISPETVYENMDLLWPAATKGMCLLRFCPQTSSDAVFCSRLYSYLNRKLKYAIIRTQNMEAFVIPLPACQPIPSRLHPLGGPGLDDAHPNLLMALLLPNHPCWPSCPKKVSTIQREEPDKPDDVLSDDFLSSIIDAVEREERQMAEQGLPPVWPPSIEQSSEVGAVGMAEVMNMLGLVTNILQEMATQNTNNYNVSTANQPNPIPAVNPTWPIPGFQPPVSYDDTNPAAMFDPSVIYGPSNVWPHTF